jgi:hypothetical protein
MKLHQHKKFSLKLLSVKCTSNYRFTIEFFLLMQSCKEPIFQINIVKQKYLI